MPAPRSPGWTLRLADLLGAPPDRAGEEHLDRLVTGSVREDADLDFKRERYGETNDDKRELAADIAAMANYRGGLIVIGVREENEVAAERTPVRLDAAEERRMRQIAAERIAPHLNFDIRPVECANDSSMGYYLLTVPPSTLRPHLVRTGRTSLGVPVRDGATKRWLGEPEIADAYRDRYRVALDQSARTSRILDDGLAVMDLGWNAFLAVAMVPTGPGSMTIDLARVQAMQQWVRDLGPPAYFEGFFDPTVSPTADVAAHRITVSPLWDRDRPRRTWYAELFDDGAGFACTYVSDARDPRGDHEDMWIPTEKLMWAIGRCLLLLGRHAARNCGAWGDALVEVKLVEQTGRPMRLAWMQTLYAGLEEPVEVDRGRPLPVAESKRTVLVEAIAAIGPDLVAAARLVATDLFHAFGSAEVRQIAPDNALRIRHLGSEAALRQWAAQHGIAVSDELVPGGE
jgi:hypothetical protein